MVETEVKNNIVKLTPENFESELKSIAEEGIGIIDFCATWCGPCSIQSKLLHENADKIKKLVERPCAFFSIDIDQDGGMSDAFAIQYVPTLVFFYRGRFGKMDSGVQKPQAIGDDAKIFVESVNAKFESGEYKGGIFDKH